MRKSFLIHKCIKHSYMWMKVFCTNVKSGEVYATWPSFFTKENKLFLPSKVISEALCVFVHSHHPVLPSTHLSLHWSHLWNTTRADTERGRSHTNQSRTLTGLPLNLPAVKFTATNREWIFNYSTFDFYNALRQVITKGTLFVWCH